MKLCGKINISLASAGEKFTIMIEEYMYSSIENERDLFPLVTTYNKNGEIQESVDLIVVKTDDGRTPSEYHGVLRYIDHEADEQDWRYLPVRDANKMIWAYKKGEKEIDASDFVEEVYLKNLLKSEYDMFNPPSSMRKEFEPGEHARLVELGYYD